MATNPSHCCERRTATTSAKRPRLRPFLSGAWQINQVQAPAASSGSSGRGRRRGMSKLFMPNLGAKALLLLAVLRHAVGWQECEVEPTDEWVISGPDSIAKHMFLDYQRRYTCTYLPGAMAAASYRFKSACTAKTFTTADVHSCLKGRRVIFLGDSLSNQQADSLVGMLDWHPSFLTFGDPLNKKFLELPDGSQIPTLLDCYRDLNHYAGRSERCYDLTASDFPRTDGHRANSTGFDARGFVESKPRSRSDRYRGQDSSSSGGDIGQNRRLQEIDVKERQDAEVDGDGDSEGEYETAVHMRMFPVPKVAGWVERALSDFNGTRASDVIVINFGAHYHETPEADEEFKADVANLLSDMARFGGDATMVWREISPTHFPSVNGSYDTFDLLPNAEKIGACCTGTPPALLDRNLWVEKYLRDNKLEDRVKILKVYRMSYLRGAAHHTCHAAHPTAPGEKPGMTGTCPHLRESTDCRHYSETGVIEEWNGLLLNHICPA